MKKVFVLFFLMLLLSYPATALDISVGAKGGVAHSGYMGQDHQDYIETHNQRNDLYIRAIFGAFATFTSNERLQIQPELLFVGSGGKAVDRTDPDSTYWKESFSYISVPVLVKGVFFFRWTRRTISIRK